jgi:hypothetical protein
MIIDELFEAPQQCPECGGISFSDLILAEKKDACYHKVKASAKVWPSAYASGRLVQCRKKGAANYGNKSEGVAEASDQSNAISQEQLNQMYANAKPMMFIKNTPVALVPLAKINQIGTPQQVQQVQQALGSVDQTSYTDEYKNKGYVVFQWNGTALDLYVASPEVVSQKYVKFSGQLPQDEKSRGKIPSLIALSKLGIDPSKVPFFVKKVPNEMVSAKQLGLEGKTIQVFWGSDPSTQEVAPGGFLTKNEHGMIYTIAPDAQGLPIGYLPAQQGVAEGKADPTGSWVVYDGSKVKRFKSREGAKAYAAKNGGKVASSEFYADKIQKQGVAEGVMYGAENLNVGDDVIISGDVELNGATGVIDSFGQDKRFVVVDLYNHGRHSFHSSDVSANDYDSDEHDDDLAETRVGQVPMTLKPGETDNLEPEDFEGFKKLPAYKQGQQAQQSRGKDLIQQSPYTYQSDQDWAYRNGAFDARQAATSADFAKRGPLTTENTLDEKSVSQAQFRTMAGAAHNPEFARKVGISQDVAQEFNRADKKSNYKKLPARATEGEQQKGADYRDPKEVDYDAIDHDKSVARLKHLAGLGPMKTTYDPAKRQYRNMPTADQPKR